MSTTDIFPDRTAPAATVAVGPPEITDARPLDGVFSPESARPRPTATPRPLPPKPKNARYESLDMWRGVACLLLVCYHAAFFTEDTMRVFDPSSWSVTGALLYAIKKTWCGVPIFFVISGYCIAASLDSLRRRPHSLANYFQRRMRRIYPPLWAATAMAIAWLLLAQSIWNLEGARDYLPFLSDLTAGQWLGNFTATEQWLHHVTGGQTRYLMANTWTLCYEEQFYALAGLMLLCAPRRPLGVAVVISLAVLAFRHLFRACGWTSHGFFCDGHWLLFAAGLLVYQAINYFPRRQIALTVAMLLAGLAYGLWERRTGPEWFDRHLGEYFIVASLFALFLMGAKQFDRAIARHRLASPFVWCGKRSYSIYLTHYVFVVPLAYGLSCWRPHDAWYTVVIIVPSCLAAAILSGWVFYGLVECHFQNTPDSGAGKPALA